MNKQEEFVYLREKETNVMVNLEDYNYYHKVETKDEWKPVTRNIAEICLKNRRINLEIVEMDQVKH
jgi:hypothetical protein